MTMETGEPQKDSITKPLVVEISEENEKLIVGNRGEIWGEVKKQVWLAGPLVCVNLLQNFLQMISVMFVGHLGELALSGSSMATSFASVTGFSFLVGMASALDTLCGQSYGAKQYHMLGINMQRAMIALLVLSVPIALVWSNTELILVTFGQHPEIARQAGIYACSMIPSLFAYGPLQCLNRFLQTQNIVFPMMIISGLTTLSHLLLCWCLVFKFGLGIRGAAFANCISYWVNVILLSLYVKFSPSCSKTWTGFSTQALHNIYTFVKLAVPSSAMVCLEMWSFEMTVLLSGLLPNPKLQTSVLSVCLNSTAVVWMIPFGLGAAVSTRVSNELGAGHPRAAQMAVMVVLFMAITEGILVGSVLLLVRNIWGYAYSNETEVVQYVSNMMPILALSHLLDGLQCVLSGIWYDDRTNTSHAQEQKMLYSYNVEGYIKGDNESWCSYNLGVARGCGWQKIGAVINLGSYYIVGIPCAALLSFVFHFGGKGLWLGIICALVVQVLSLFTVTIRTNWDHEAQKATERVYGTITPKLVIVS